jgi:predicted RNA-binding protein with PUA-like domain
LKTQLWLVKQEPEDYVWHAFVKDGKTSWDGVRNYQARNNLKAMKVGDPVLFYASGGPKEVVGIAEVLKTAFPDPTAEEEGWVSVILKPVSTLKTPVTLAQIKADPLLKEMVVAKNSRLSVSPVTPAEFARIKLLGAK